MSTSFSELRRQTTQQKKAQKTTHEQAVLCSVSGLPLEEAYNRVCLQFAYCDLELSLQEFLKFCETYVIDQQIYVARVDWLKFNPSRVNS